MPTDEHENARRTRGRNPNKTIWNLKDARALLLDAYPHWQVAMDRAEELRDAALVIELARLRDYLARLERKVGDALAGEYREGGDD